MRALQRALSDQGARFPASYRNGDFDGIFGAETARAVRDFQVRHGLAADAIAGRQTITKLDEIYRFNDPFFGNPLVERTTLLAQMTMPPGEGPFASISKPKS